VASLCLPWAVVTSGDRRLAYARLGAAGLRPPVVVTADDVSVGKPDPEGYLLAAKLLGVPPPECVVVEDAPAGVEAGRRAGMSVVGIHGVVADTTVETLAELAVLVRQWSAVVAADADAGAHSDLG
jgi:sugar-phosphatase